VLGPQGEVKFPVVLEDEGHKEVPNIQLFFRPVRQMVYAVLFNVHHQKYLASKTNGAKGTPKRRLRRAFISELVLFFTPNI
jgi:hypothetical protein